MTQKNIRSTRNAGSDNHLTRRQFSMSRNVRSVWNVPFPASIQELQLIELSHWFLMLHQFQEHHSSLVGQVRWDLAPLPLPVQTKQGSPSSAWQRRPQLIVVAFSFMPPPCIYVSIREKRSVDTTGPERISNHWVSVSQVLPDGNPQCGEPRKLN
jgi:hypothetical protein